MNNFFFFLDLKTNTRGGECQAVRVGKFTIFSNGLRIISVHGALLCNIGKKKQGEESCEGAQNFPFDLFVVPETALLASATVLPRYYSLVVMIRVSAPRARPLSIASE